MVVVLVSLFIYSFKPNTMDKVLAKAFVSSEQTTHYVEVYDNSTDDVVDKLVIVNPYGWILWNFDGRLFIVNPEVGVQTCTRGFSVYEVSSNLAFVKRCVNAKLIDLLNFYHTKRTAEIVPFEPKNVYTILDCIEFLSNGIVYINTSGKNNFAQPIEFSSQAVYNSLQMSS